MDVQEMKAKRLKEKEDLLRLTPKSFKPILKDEYAYSRRKRQFYEVKKSQVVPKKFTTVAGRVVNGTKLRDELLRIRPLKIRFARGPAIHKVFEKYRPGSCMRYRHLRHLREVYARNPSKVCAAYLMQKDHPMLQSDWSALVWTIKGVNYIDRSYSNGYMHDGDLDLIYRSVADQMGNGFPAKTLYYKVNGLPLHESPLEVNLWWKPDQLLPYADSFCDVVKHTSRTVTLGHCMADGYAVNLESVHGVCADGKPAWSTCKKCKQSTRDYEHCMGHEIPKEVLCRGCDKRLTCWWTGEKCESVKEYVIHHSFHHSETKLVSEAAIEHEFRTTYDDKLAPWNSIVYCRDGLCAMHDDPRLRRAGSEYTLAEV